MTCKWEKSVSIAVLWNIPFSNCLKYHLMTKLLTVICPIYSQTCFGWYPKGWVDEHSGVYHWALFSESQISSCFSLLRPLGLCELLKQVSADYDGPTVPLRSTEYACSEKRSWPVDLCLVLFLLFSLSECNYVCAIPLPRDGSVVCVPALKDCPASLITLPQPATEDRSIDKEGISGLCGHMYSSDCKRFL